MRGGPTLIIDVGTATAAAIVVTEVGSWLVPEPTSGEARWPSGRLADGPRGVVELFAALRAAAGRLLGSRGSYAAAPDRAVVTVPASVGSAHSPHPDPWRGQLIAAAEAAGFTAVELLVEAAGAVWAPGSPARIGDLVLVYDLGATFQATLVRVGDDLPDVLGEASIVDLPGVRAAAEVSAIVDLTLACCQDLLARTGVSRTEVAWVLPVGGGARMAGLGALIEHGLGIAVAPIDQPELAVLAGAAVWLPRSGPRSVVARGSGPRMVPLLYTIPGGTAVLVRWLVEPQQPYEEGATVARVRVPGGAVWDLTARAPGVLDEVLVPGGSEVRSGEWLALVHPT
jgi:hypothetical protein